MPEGDGAEEYGTREPQEGDESPTRGQHPRTKNGHVFSGVCDRCGEPIYTFSDHGNCLFGSMDS